MKSLPQQSKIVSADYKIYWLAAENWLKREEKIKRCDLFFFRRKDAYNGYSICLLLANLTIFQEHK